MKDSLKVNRREFLRLSAGVGAAITCPSIIMGCFNCNELPILPEYRPNVSSAWIPKGDHEDSYTLFTQMVESATDFTWLSSGDRVFLKLALNSYHPFPATTDPWTLHCMIKLLQEKGAGEILVGDQSGIGHVYHTRTIQNGSSRDCCQRAGLLDVIEENDATPVFFEEAGFDDGYRPVHPSGPHHWGSTPIYITKAIDDVDHIINLPRVANHSMAGTTFGLKLSIGFLRTDTRAFNLHADFLNFNDKYEEVNHIPEIESKVRLTVSSGRSLLTTNGPDTGQIVEPDHGLIFASEDLLANDLLASAWLETNRSGEAEDIYCHPATRRYMEIKGGRPEELNWDPINSHPDPDVTGYIENLMYR